MIDDATKDMIKDVARILDENTKVQTVIRVNESELRELFPEINTILYDSYPDVEQLIEACDYSLVWVDGRSAGTELNGYYRLKVNHNV